VSNKFLPLSNLKRNKWKNHKKRLEITTYVLYLRSEFDLVCGLFCFAFYLHSRGTRYIFCIISFPSYSVAKKPNQRNIYFNMIKWLTGNWSVLKCPCFLSICTKCGSFVHLSALNFLLKIGKFAWDWMLHTSLEQ